MDWRTGLGLLLRDLGLGLKIVVALLVVSLGERIFDDYTGTSSWWAFFPVILGGVMMLAGAAAAVLLLWQRVVRLKLDVAAKSAEFSPVQEDKTPTGAAS